MLTLCEKYLKFIRKEINDREIIFNIIKYIIEFI